MTIHSESQTSSLAEAHTSTHEAADLVETLLRVAQHIRRVLNERLDACGLNDVRYTVLDTVSRTAERGGCSQAELANRLDQSESSVSMLVDRMRADRLLHRLHAPTDRRRRRLVLTEDGRTLVERGRQVYTHFVDELLRAVSNESGLRTLLNELSTTLVDLPFAKPAVPTSHSNGESSTGLESQRLNSHTTESNTTSPSEISPAA